MFDNYWDLTKKVTRMEFIDLHSATRWLALEYDLIKDDDGM